MEAWNIVIDNINSNIWNKTIDIICQAFLYGIYLCLFPIAVHAMVTNGLQSRARKSLLAIITFLFTLITAYWIFSIGFTFLSIDSNTNAVTPCYGNKNASACATHRLAGAVRHLPSSLWMAMFDDMLLANFIIADGVVVWRAWVLCFDQSKVVLMIPVVMLVINTVVYLITVVVRAIEISKVLKDIPLLLHLVRFTSIAQVTHLALSLVINVYATSIIALKAWKYRKLLMESGVGIRTPRQAIKILALLVESGMIYILIGVTSLTSIAIFMHLRLNSMATLILRVGVQLVGIYPIVVVLLVEKNRSLDTTYRSFGTIIDVWGDRSSQAERITITFAPGPVPASRGEIDLGTKSSNHDADNHVPFDSTPWRRETEK